jgi:hypothetical protein
MDGPYELTEEIIDKFVENKVGNYALGVAAKGIFAVKYVGRSDTNINSRLKGHLDESYAHFEFTYTSNPIAAYQKECRDYHAFIDAGKKLDNDIHPRKPKDAPKDLKCSICGQ